MGKITGAIQAPDYTIRNLVPMCRLCGKLEIFSVHVVDGQPYHDVCLARDPVFPIPIRSTVIAKGQ